MELIRNIGIIFLSAIVVENVVFARGLGTSNLMGMTGDAKGILDFGVLVTQVTVLSAVLSWFCNLLISTSPYKTYIKNITFLFCITIAYLAIRTIYRLYLPNQFEKIEKLLPTAAFNGAVLGSILLAASQRYTLLKTIGYAFGSAIGFDIALLLVFSGRERMGISNVPRSFKGQPVLLIYIGILSLAIYGLIGHQLPT